MARTCLSAKLRSVRPRVFTSDDAVWLTRELNDQADCCILTWLPEHAGMSQPEYASFRRYALALKAAAVVIGEGSGGPPMP